MKRLIMVTRSLHFLTIFSKIAKIILKGIRTKIQLNCMVSTNV